MDNEIVLLELFAGIGGFHKGLHDSGFKVKKCFYSEIDKHAIANYKYNFPNAEYIGSVTDVRGERLERPNIITFGSPCQDFSLAGKRKGMEGQRSSLILHAIRLIRECRPNFFIWENVKGAYSSNSGADFWGIIQAFANIGGYRLEWQLLNTSWFLPQNRERIYLIGHLAEEGRDFKGIFPIRKTDCIYNERGCKKSGEIASTLNANDNKSWVGNFVTNLAGNEINGALLSGHRGSLLAKNSFDIIKIQEEPICVASRGRNPENSSDRTTRAHTEQRLEPNSQGTTNTLTSVAKDNLIMIKSNTEKGFEEAKEGDSINFSNPSSKTRRGRVGKGKGKAQTLDTACNQAVIQLNPSKESGGKQPYQQNRVFAKEGLSPTIDQSAGRWQTNTTNIRRLTEIECERLQGFPDGWTELGNYDGEIKKIPKTQRYKLLGNAVTRDVVEAIGIRLLNINK